MHYTVDTTGSKFAETKIWSRQITSEVANSFPRSIFLTDDTYFVAVLNSGRFFVHHDTYSADSVMRATSGRGKTYSTSNVDYLLDLIEELLPCGIDEWTEVASRFNLHFGNGESRSGDDLRNKFKVFFITGS